jgi:hypothetical protein
MKDRLPKVIFLYRPWWCDGMPAMLMLAGLENSLHLKKLDKLLAHLYRLIMKASNLLPLLLEPNKLFLETETGPESCLWLGCYQLN